MGKGKEESSKRACGKAEKFSHPQKVPRLDKKMRAESKLYEWILKIKGFHHRSQGSKVAGEH
jgi:hypothetical protein